jgi:hypothetical protein
VQAAHRQTREQQADVDARVSVQQLHKLAASQDIRLALQNTELQAMITAVDTASNREAALQTLLDSNPDFLEFIDAMLKTIEHESAAREAPTPTDEEVLKQHITKMAEQSGL